MGISDSTVIDINPDFGEAHELKGWYDSKGKDMQFRSFSSEGSGGSGAKDAEKTIAQISDESMGMGEKVFLLFIF